MLKRLTVICGLLLAASAAMAELPWSWMPLDSTPLPVGEGAHITYGVNPDYTGAIWGMFPIEADSTTYVYYYSPLPGAADTNDPNVGEWESLPSGNSRWFGYTLAYSGMTYQWNKALYVIGADTSNDELPPQGYLDWYSMDSDTWSYYDIDEDTEFVLGEGACIAYAPNPGYDWSNQVAGSIYCLPGGGSEFWCYSIQPDADIAVAGVFPPDGSSIADKTPRFQWNPGSSNQYRLQVSTDLSFSGGSFIIDTVVGVAEFQTPSNLADTLYGWRVGVPFNGGWWWGLTRSFAQVGGFVNLHKPIPQGVARGAAMAYSGGLWQGHPSIIVLNGYLDDGENPRYFHKYDIGTKQWSDLSFTDPAPRDEMAGTSLTTGDPIIGESGWYASAVFGNSNTVNRPYAYAPCRVDGDRWREYDSLAFDPFPQYIGPGAEFVQGPAPFCYLTTGATSAGEPTKCFYAIDPERGKRKKDKDRGGSQAGDILAGDRRARVIVTDNGMEIEYQLPAAARVRATLHDAVGRQLGVLDAGSQQAGAHRLSWSQDRGGRGLAAGAYFVRLEMGVEKATIKAVIR
jgi:hypothetical protein